MIYSLLLTGLFLSKYLSVKSGGDFIHLGFGLVNHINKVKFLKNANEE